MSFLFTMTKLAALAAALLCLTSIGPGLLLADINQPAVRSAAPAAPAGTALRCRMYFGCAPAGL
jgi:hypothetical protein